MVDWNILVQGLTIGSVYALAGTSINIIYRPTNTFNLAQGNLVMLGSIVCASLIGSMGLNWFVAAGLTLVSVGLIAGFIDVVAVAPVLARPRANGHGWIISTLAVALIIEDIVGKLVGPDPKALPPPPPLSTRPIAALASSVNLSTYQIFMIVFVVLLVLGTEMFYRLRIGKAILAISEDREASLLRGIDPKVLARVSFAISGVVAALAGILAGPILFASIPIGGIMLIKGFEAAALGGIGSNKGAVIGGYVLGLVEILTATTLSPGYQDAATFAVVLGLLLIRPQGFFGKPIPRAV
jgi:branched-chain amino acid transport system permease protein